MASVLFLALETHFRKYNSSQWRCSVLCCSASAVARTPVLPSESSHSWGGHNCHLYSHILTSWNILRFFPTPLFMLLFTTLWQPSVLALVLVLFFVLFCPGLWFWWFLLLGLWIFLEGKTVATLYFGQSQIAVHLEDLQLSTEKFIE